jgi:hypothetical protein
MDRELWAKLLWENVKEKGLRLSEGRSPRVEDTIGLKGHMSLDHGLQVKCSGSKQSLRIETPEARKEKSISSIGLEGHMSPDR